MEQFAELSAYVKQYRINNLEHNVHFLSDQEIIGIAEEAGLMLNALPNVIELRSEKLMVIGDLHGTYEALLQIFPARIDPSITYVFLGDYVDRGFFGIEIMYVLLSLYVMYPKNVVLLRGNHECRHVSFQYGLFFEIFVKYAQPSYQNIEVVHDIFNALVGVFLMLPVAAYNPHFVFVHAGVPGNQMRLLDLNQMQRRREIDCCENNEITNFDPLSDVLWADFDADQPQLFTHNSARGVSIVFNDEARELFTGGRTLVRSHTAVNGVCKSAGVITVFSVPHYDGANKGAFLQIEAGNVTAKTFTTQRHAWIDSYPIFQNFSCKSNKNMVFGIMLGMHEVEIEPKFEYLICETGETYRLRREQRLFLTDLLMDYYEQYGESPLQLLSMIDNVEDCVKIMGKSLAQWGYRFPRVFTYRLAVDEIKKIISQMY